MRAQRPAGGADEPLKMPTPRLDAPGRLPPHTHGARSAQRFRLMPHASSTRVFPQKRTDMSIKPIAARDKRKVGFF